MTKVLLNKNKLESDAIIELQHTIDYLERAINECDSMRVPSFSYSSYLSDLPNVLNNKKLKYQKTLDWINKSITNYEKFTQDTSESFNNFVIQEVSPKIEHANTLY